MWGGYDCGVLHVTDRACTHNFYVSELEKNNIYIVTSVFDMSDRWLKYVGNDIISGRHTCQ